MSFATLRALHALIGAAIDDIERVYTDAPPATPPISPLARKFPPATHPFSPTHSSSSSRTLATLSDPRPSTPPPPRIDYPSLDVPSFTLPPTSSTPLIPTRSPVSPNFENPYTYSQQLLLHEAEQLTQDPRAVAASAHIVAACAQLSASVRRPFLTLCDAAMGYHLPACLRFLEASHTVEILREAGPGGLHVSQLARRISSLIPGEPPVDPAKISHILRLLATHHIGREVRPDVFANNRVSSELDTGRGTDELRERPEEKYEGTNGSAAFIALCTDELFKASAYLTDEFLPSAECPPELAPLRSSLSREKPNFNPTPDTSHPMHAPFNIALSTSTTYFEWLETAPGNAHRLRRFGRAMTGAGGMEGAGGVLDGFPWEELPEGSVVVDVGGGIGSVSGVLAEKFQGLRFLVQDRKQVVEQGEAEWRLRCPEMLDSGRVAFQVHDFFEPQPPWPSSFGRPQRSLRDTEDSQDVAVFLLRVITHDWPDEYVIRILKHLRAAAGPTTRLLIADHILPLACVDEDVVTGDDSDEAQEGAIPGTIQSLAPEGSPLLPNLGKANAVAYWLDMTMHVTFNSRERTLREMAELVRRAGWRVVSVRRGPGTVFGYVVSEPMDIGGAVPKGAHEEVGGNIARKNREAEGGRDDKGPSNRSPLVSEPDLVRANGRRMDKDDGEGRVRVIDAQKSKETTILLPAPRTLRGHFNPGLASPPAPSTLSPPSHGLLPSPLILPTKAPKTKVRKTEKSEPTVALSAAGVEVTSSPEGERTHHRAFSLGVADADAVARGESPVSSQWSVDSPEGSASASARSPRPALSPQSPGRRGMGIRPWAVDTGDTDVRQEGTLSPSQPGDGERGLRRMRSKTELRKVLSQADLRRGESDAAEGGGGRRRSISRPRVGQDDSREAVPPVPPLPSVPLLDWMNWRRRQAA